MDPHAAEPTAVPAPTTAPLPAAAVAAVPALRRQAWLLAASHALVDVFPMAITSLMIVLTTRLNLTTGQETIIWIASPIFSGLFQPLFAWFGDRYDTRLAGPLGLAIGAIGISSIGLARSFEQLLVLQIVGVIGVGMYHPAAASLAGQMGSAAARGRAFAMSVFIAAGMVGHTVGPIIATRINAWYGMEHLLWLIPPSLMIAVWLHLAVRHVPHRPLDHRAMQASWSVADNRSRWVAAVLLTTQNALRFCVNIGMYIMVSYWARRRIPGDADSAAELAGNLAAATTIGMGAGGLLLGRYMRPGTERLVFALCCFGGALCIAAVNVAGAMGNWAAYLALGLAAVGFFGPVPSAIGLGQRLLPSHAALVTSLLMGVGWMFGALSRPISQALLGVSSLDDARLLTSADFNRGFGGFAVILAVAGLLNLAMPARAIREAVRTR